jgi:hypothetical protein
MLIRQFDLMREGEVAMKKVYLMCPYSHSDPKILEQRFEMANKAAVYLMKKGFLVFSPISHSHPIGSCLKNTLDHDFWLKQDRSFIDWADIGVILCIDGWKESKGINMERRWLKKAGKSEMFLNITDSPANKLSFSPIE